MRKLRPQEIRQLAQDHRADKQQSWDLNPRSAIQPLSSCQHWKFYPLFPINLNPTLRFSVSDGSLSSLIMQLSPSACHPKSDDRVCPPCPIGCSFDIPFPLPRTTAEPEAVRGQCWAKPRWPAHGSLRELPSCWLKWAPDIQDAAMAPQACLPRLWRMFPHQKDSYVWKLLWNPSSGQQKKAAVGRTEGLRVKESRGKRPGQRPSLPLHETAMETTHCHSSGILGIDFFSELYASNSRLLFWNSLDQIVPSHFYVAFSANMPSFFLKLIQHLSAASVPIPLSSHFKHFLRHSSLWIIINNQVYNLFRIYMNQANSFGSYIHQSFSALR